MAKLSDLHARGIAIESDDAFFLLAAAWHGCAEALQGRAHLTKNWRPTASSANHLHSITLSARASSIGGISRSSALAVFRLNSHRRMHPHGSHLSYEPSIL
jgi:hypothetical protein